MLRWVAIIILLCIFVLALALAYANGESVMLDYLMGSAKVHLSSALLGAAVIGWLFGLLSSLGVIFRLKRQVWRLKRSVRDAETEIRNLRNIPLKNDH
ncbi:MAG: LapA family protein [Gammaproteobacteria bacterium]|nr:LapA family protein [Gammaproteobacteria bacterium]MDE2346301.1 LapA family protein [Gammaproteobacteria bacterium]